MALWSTSCRGKQHRVRTGGEQGTEQRGERKGTDDGTGNGQGTVKVESDGSEEDKGEQKRKSNRFWGM